MTAEQQIFCNTVLVNGMRYATLDFTAPDSTSKEDQRGFIECPTGWDIAPAMKEVIQEVIAKHPWGATHLHLADGSAYGTSVSSSPGMLLQTDNVSWDSGRAKPTNMDHGYHRILISNHLLQSATHSADLGKRLFSAGCFTDCVIECGDHQIKCHRAVLSLSPVFKAMLESHLREGTEHRITISDADPCVVDSLVHFIYLGRVAFKAEEVGPLVSLADKYGMEDLCLLCANKLVDRIDEETVIDTVKRLRPFADRDAFRAIFATLRETLAKKEELLDIVIKRL